MSRSATDDRGVALVIVLLAMSLLLAIGLALTTVALSETSIAGSYADASQTLYAAESAVDYAIQALAREANWQAVVDGDAVSSLRADEVLNVLQGEEVPAGTLYAYGWLAELFPSDRPPVPAVVLAWVAADDEVQGRLIVTGRAYGLNGSRRSVEIRLEPTDGRPRIVSWREVR
jgi:hypothetical protein